MSWLNSNFTSHPSKCRNPQYEDPKEQGVLFIAVLLIVTIISSLLALFGWLLHNHRQAYESLRTTRIAWNEAEENLARNLEILQSQLNQQDASPLLEDRAIVSGFSTQGQSDTPQFQIDLDIHQATVRTGPFPNWGEILSHGHQFSCAGMREQRNSSKSSKYSCSSLPSLNTSDLAPQIIRGNLISGDALTISTSFRFPRTLIILGDLEVLHLKISGDGKLEIISAGNITLGSLQASGRPETLSISARLGLDMQSAPIGFANCSELQTGPRLSLEGRTLKREGKEDQNGRYGCRPEKSPPYWVSLKLLAENFHGRDS